MALVLEGLVGSFNHSTLAYSALVDWSIDLDYCDIEWSALEMNRDHSVIFEIASKYCILDSFVDYEGYFIFFKGILAHSRYNGHLS